MYESCSDQSVNYEKSMVCFSTNSSRDNRDVVSNLLRVNCSNDIEKYLGLSILVGRKKVSFQNIKD